MNKGEIQPLDQLPHCNVNDVDGIVKVCSYDVYACVHVRVWHTCVINQKPAYVSFWLCTFPLSLLTCPPLLCTSFLLHVSPSPSLKYIHIYIQYYKMSEPELNTSSLVHYIATRIPNKDLLSLTYVASPTSSLHFNDTIAQYKMPGRGSWLCQTKTCCD